ncbi:ABC transporter ATP-binding protein [Natranaeroarchaeum aerophilus]|uniref:ABC transporter ATP-binding protein n=1 Tax=Natranaeroarchaeum aerophilus TaxID=2917711 RepID=UPI003369D3D6
MGAIETNGLTKQYGSETALSSLDLDVEEGEVFGFLGPNGAGKTTTIDLLLDFIRPTDGSATVLGYDAHEEPGSVRERVGILPDGFDLWERSTGYRHLEFAIESTGGESDPDELLDRVGLDREAAKRSAGEYSKGMGQRLAMAMALAGDPDLLILDEPSSGLDPHGITTMQEIVREEAASGTTVFFSSHILGQVSAVCDRVGILDDGELATVDTIEGLRDTAGVGSRLIVETSGTPPTDIPAIEGVAGVAADGPTFEVSYTDPVAKGRVIHRIVEEGVEVVDFATEEATLEDLFSAFTATDAESLTTGVGDETDTDIEDGADTNAGGRTDTDVENGADTEPVTASGAVDDVESEVTQR